MKKLLLLAICMFLVVTTFAQQKATKTITNADVEQFRQKRVQAEEDYKRNYKQLGMPSPEELEKRNQDSQDWREDFSRKQAQVRAQQGGDIGYRANVLSSQIASNAAQINYLRSVIARIPTNNNVIDASQLNQYVFPNVYQGSYYYPYASSGEYLPDNNRTYSSSQSTIQNTISSSQQAAPNPAIAGALAAQNMSAAYNLDPNYLNPQIRSRQVTPNPAIAGALAAQNLSAAYNLDPNYLNQRPINRRPVSVYGRGGWRRVERRQPYYYPGYIYSYPFPVNSNNQVQRSELVMRLRLLEQERAGLLAQWNALEEEAHRAGVRIN